MRSTCLESLANSQVGKRVRKKPTGAADVLLGWNLLDQEWLEEVMVNGPQKDDRGQCRNKVTREAVEDGGRGVVSIGG